VIPGAVMTNIEASFASPFAEEVLGPVMAATIQSVLEPDQLAAAICFLLSDDASGINGALLPVDGGWSVI
jgi:NAD(P)-dependent dehydrogenase (short-subunit alcohol dehydrogenase family)